MCCSQDYDNNTSLIKISGLIEKKMANTSADFKVTFTKQNWFCLDQSSSQGFHIIHEKRTGGEEL